MSRFSETLTEIMTANGWNQPKLSDLTKFDVPRISRWAKGNVAPKPETLPQLLGVFSAEERAKLLVAYLRDEIPSQYADLIDISARGATTRIGEPPQDNLQPPDGISRELLTKIYRVAALARDVPEIAAIFEEFNRLILRAAGKF